MLHKRLKICRVLVLALACAWASQAQTPPLLDVKPTVPVQTGETLTLAKIDFAGLNKRTAEQALAVSGLRVGQSLTRDEIEEAAQRLSDSGWFKRLGYRLKGATEAIALTFTVEEDEITNIPVVFDNFIWFSDEEIAQALRGGGILGFDGTIPEGGKTADLVVQILAKEMAKQRLPGRIEYDFLASESGPGRIIFTVRDVKMPICSLAFPGASVVPEKLLQNTASELLNQEYSRYAALFVAQSKLRPLYRQRGYWRVQFGAATAQTVREKDCGGEGARVSVPVREGPQYLWAATTWAGNTAYQPLELDATLGLKAGEPADERQLDRGLRQINQLYQRKGYLDLLVSVSPAFDDPQKRLGWRLSLNEGPQYRMGRLTIANLPPADTLALTKEWKIKAGQPHDIEYLNEFVTTTMLPRLAQLGPGAQGLKVKTQQTPDKQKFTVDVMIELVRDEKPNP